MSPRQVIALILAAGQSRRMGRQKLLLPFRDGTILDAVLAAVLESAVDGLVLVANRDIAAYLGDSLPERCHLAHNDDPNSDMLTSVKIGTRLALAEFELTPEDGLVILPGDQPQITGGVITTVAEAYRLPRRPPGILTASYRGRRGHPTIFSTRLLREIEDWPNDRGLNELAKIHPEELRELKITICPMPIDVNTPQDYDRLTGPKRPSGE
jgi:molybdenum cofactor cytidylyltransferase